MTICLCLCFLLYMHLEKTIFNWIPFYLHIYTKHKLICTNLELEWTIISLIVSERTSLKSILQLYLFLDSFFDRASCFRVKKILNNCYNFTFWCLSKMVAWSLTLIHVYTMFDPLTYTWTVDHTLLGLTNPRELRINDLKT